jgi:hypothetical protein
MQLTDEDIREFQELWQKEFQESLADDEARNHASQLLELYALLAGSHPSVGDAHQ